MRIIECTAANAERWDAFVNAHPEGSFFHQFGWRDVFERVLGHKSFYLMAEDNGRVCAVLPLVYTRSLIFGRALSSLPFSTYAGVLASDDHATVSIEAEALQLARRLGVGSIEYRLRKPGKCNRPSKQLYELFTKRISPDADENMRAIRSKQRNVIRKGIKNGLSMRIDDVAGFYPAYAESVRNLGTPVFPRSLFGAIKQAFPQQVEIISACLDERVISSSVNFYYRNTLCPYYWGGVFDARRLSGNDFLAWQIMCRGAERGCTEFDFGRSKKGTGSHRWKLNLGFEPVPLYYEYELVNDHSVPNINPLNPKYRLFVETWKKLPLPIANVLGPLVSRSLG